MLKTIVAVALLTTGWAPGYAVAPTAQATPAPVQESPKPQVQATEEKGQQPPEPRRARTAGPLYRVEVTIAELEGKTRTNSRTYSLLARALGDPAYLRVGSRVPVAQPDKGPTYMNVGVNIDVGQVTESDGLLGGFVSLEVSSLAPPEQGQSMPGAPVTRTLNLRSPFLVTPGKTAVVGIIDDVNSPRRFQVELTATKQ